MKNFIRCLFYSFIISIFLFSSVASALTIYSGEFVTLSEDSLDDVYIFAGKSDIRKIVKGDVYIAGGEIDIDAVVEEDLVVAGGTVNINANVNGDVRVFGGQVTINSRIGDDVVAAGGKIDIGRKAEINGSVVAGSGYMSIEGLVKEDVKGSFGALFMYGEVVGDVEVTVKDNLEISKDAKIGGDLNYSAFFEADVPPKVVKGTTSFNKYDDETIPIADITIAAIIAKTMSYLGALVLILVLVFLAPLGLVRAGEMVKENVLQSFGFGLLTFIVTLVGIVILMMTLVGIPLALIVLVGFFVMMYISKIFTAAWVAVYFLPKLKGRAKKRTKVSKPLLFFLMAGALLLYYIIGMIPIVGWIANIALFFIGLGAIVMLKKDLWTFLRDKKMI